MVGISVNVVSMTTIDHGTDPPGVPGICRKPPVLLGTETRGVPELAALGDEVGDSLSGPSGATGSTRLGPRSTHGTSESGTASDSCAAIGAANASRITVKMANHWRAVR